MCGIAGYLAFDGEPDPSSLPRMIAAMSHRGPDDGGAATFAGSPARVGLCHRRLAILDLSPGGHQPFASQDGRHHLTYNGELYNYLELRSQLQSQGRQFRTASDTEVVVQAYQHWGPRCVEHFNGIFALAIWDEEARELFCARDHLGVKPLHYTTVDGVFYFASETTALLRGVANDWQLDERHVLAYLHAMYVPHPHSIVRGIHKLPPASTLTVRAHGSVRVSQYWRITSFGTRERADADEQFRSLLDDAVRIQTRSDVPVATFLSGGIDSSAIAVHVARQSTSPIHTFSVGYEGHDVDERPFARALAERVGSDHHELLITAAQLERDLERSIDRMPEPLADSAMLPTFLLCEWARQFGIKVVLNGTGGDEVFGGYSRYQPSGIARQMFEAIPPSVRKTLAGIVGLADTPTALRFRYRSSDLVGSIAGDLRGLQHVAGNDDVLASYCRWLEEQTADAYLTPGAGHPRYQKMHFDLRYYLVDDLLMLLDGMAMASGVEGRVPLLDFRLVEFMYALPEHVHFDKGLKSFARRALRDVLPPEVLNRRKMGFGGPVPFWMRVLLTPERRRALAESSLAGTGLRSDDLRQWLLSPAPAEADYWLMFRLYLLDRWHQHVFVPARTDGLRRHSHA